MYNKITDSPIHMCNGTISHTGSTTETIIHSSLIKANTVFDQDSLEVQSLLGGTGGTTRTFRWYLNTTNSLSGATLIGTRTYSTSTITSFNRTYTYGGSANTWLTIAPTADFASSFITDNSATYSGITLNFTTDQYFIVTVQQTTAGNTSRLHLLRSEIYRGNF